MFFIRSPRRAVLRLAGVFLGLTLSGTQAAYACACCAEPGARFFYELEMVPGDIEELARLRQAGPARLYMDACGDECVQGISEISERYAADFSITNGVLRITVAEPVGTIRMVLPDHFTQLGVDTDPLGPGYQRILYNEFTYQGQVSADGIFAGADQAKAELVLAGNANMCWSVGNYSHWILQVRDAGVDFQLFGGLRVQ